MKEGIWKLSISAFGPVDGFRAVGMTPYLEKDDMNKICWAATYRKNSW